MKATHLFFYFFLIFLSTSSLLAQPGALDGTFGKDGVSFARVGSHEDIAQDLLIQPDGKILLAGYSDSVGQETSMIRLNTDGTLDTSFGTKGKVIFKGETHSHNQRLTLYPDGKILIAADDAARPVLMRFHSNGKPDSSFGTNGRLGEENLSHGVYHRAFLFGDSMIVAAGSHSRYTNDSTNGFYDYALTWITPSGKIDSSHGINGRIYHDILNKYDYAADALAQPGGKIIMAGSAGDYFIKHFHLIRFMPEGKVDSSFGTNGVTMTNITDSMDWLLGLSSQPDGKLLAAGIWYDKRRESPAIVRYDANGIPDTSFGQNGIVKMSHGLKSDWIYRAMMDSNKRIIAVGSTYDGTTSAFSLYRFDEFGNLDSAFGVNGHASFDIGSKGDGAETVAVQADGNYILGGDSYRNDTAQYDFAVIRVLSEGKSGVASFDPLSYRPDITIYPNPSSDELRICYELEKDEYCTLEIFSETGMHIASLMKNNYRSAGKNEEIFSVRDLLPGTYFLNIHCSGNSSAKKFIKFH
jgi:uncharacterized delta-60 repeat protein